MKNKLEHTPLLTPQDALIAIMIAEGLSDETISGREFLSISKIVDHLPIFSTCGQLHPISRLDEQNSFELIFLN